MTTDELLMKLPSHIGRNKFHGFYIPDTKRGADTGWLYLHNDGKDWCASYGREGNRLHSSKCREAAAKEQLKIIEE